MDRAQVLLEGLWEPFSFLPLFGYSCLGLLLGAVAGLLLTLQLQRSGWLAGAAQPLASLATQTVLSAVTR
jgi:hypothetical protein